MLNIEKYQIACANILNWLRKGRGGIYLGGYDVLGATVLGHQMVVDSRHEPSLKNLYVPPYTETSVLALMACGIQHGMVVVDVGAGCGYYSIIASLVVGPHGKIYSFDPIPECCQLIEKNKELNAIENLTCINRLVLDGSLKRKFKYFGGNYQFFFLHAEDNKEKIIDAESVSLDHYFLDRETSIDFVKINFEKDLPFVIKGMSDIIKFNYDIKILCLFNKDKIQKGGNDPGAFLDDLIEKKLNFHILPSLKQIDKEELLSYEVTKYVLLTKSTL